MNVYLVFKISVGSVVSTEIIFHVVLNISVVSVVSIVSKISVVSVVNEEIISYLVLEISVVSVVSGEVILMCYL